MSKKTQLIITIIIALVFFALGYTFSLWKNKTSANNPINNNTFKAGWEAARARLIEHGFIRANFELRQLSGEIMEINGNKITLKIQTMTDPLADISLDTRTVIIDSATKIYSSEMKDSKEYGAEINAYNKLPKDKRPVDLPDIFKKNEISLSDLKIGQMIIVVAAENIKEAKEFKAIEINYTKSEASSTAPAL